LRKTYAKCCGWVKSRGAWGIVTVAGVVSVVLFSSVGVTIAVTGVFPSLVVTPPPTPAPSPVATSSGLPTSVATSRPGTSEPPSELNLSTDPITGSVGAAPPSADTTWVGAKFYFRSGGYSLLTNGISAGPTGGGNVYEEIIFNGRLIGSGFRTCHTALGKGCGGSSSGSLEASSGYLCNPGGDTYSIRVWGSGIDFQESGMIPAGIVDCPVAPAPPAPVAPAPSASTSSSPEPTVESTPEPTVESTPAG
jgi:hypothetical protein